MTPVTEQRTITVDGMTCTGCEESVQRAVGSLDGIEVVEADHRAGTVAVRYAAEATTEDEIVERIREAGYTVA